MAFCQYRDSNMLAGCKLCATHAHASREGPALERHLLMRGGIEQTCIQSIEKQRACLLRVLLSISVSSSLPMDKHVPEFPSTLHISHFQQTQLASLVMKKAHTKCKSSNRTTQHQHTNTEAKAGPILAMTKQYCYISERT